MRLLFRLIMFMLVSLIATPVVDAASYGDRLTAPSRHVVDGPSKLRIRKAPNTNAEIVGTVKDGDVVYLNPDILENDGERDWRYIDGFGYIAMPTADAKTLLLEAENPFYNNEEKVEIAKDVESTQHVAKIILLVLMGIGLVIAILGAFGGDLTKKSFLGHPDSTGMTKTFFFNRQPYLAIIYITLILALIVVAALLVELLLGGLAWVLLWAVKILAYIVLWVGIAVCILGVIACFTGAGIVIGIIMAAVGGFIWYNKSSIEDFAEACSETGLAVWNELNLLDFMGGLVHDYWKTALIVICAPLALFLALAILWMIISGILILTEKIVTWHYNMKHPCPKCHQPSEPATYLSFNYDTGEYEEFPEGVKLRPSPYGLFHVTHPVTGERMATMLFNGRDEHERRCAQCGHIMSAKEGEEKHVVLVGGPESGKSTLVYRVIAEMRDRGGYKVKFTDEQHSMKDADNVIRKIESIAREHRISEDNLPGKTTDDDIVSTQLSVEQKHALVPIRLFINDVSGEFFSNITNSSSQVDLSFFNYTNSIIFLIDPLTMNFDASGNVKSRLKKWFDKMGIQDNESIKLDPQTLRDAVDGAIIQSGVPKSKINVNFVLVKSDIGYITDADMADADAIKAFMIEELDLGPVINWPGFKSVNFFAISAMAKGDDSNINPLLDSLLGQLNISLD